MQGFTKEIYLEKDRWQGYVDVQLQMFGQTYFLFSVDYFSYGYGFDEFMALLHKVSNVFILFV